jgi:hypothetical protein
MLRGIVKVCENVTPMATRLEKPILLLTPSVRLNSPDGDIKEYAANVIAEHLLAGR